MHNHKTIIVITKNKTKSKSIMAHTKLQTYYIIVPFTIITEIQFPLKKDNKRETENPIIINCYSFSFRK